MGLKLGDYERRGEWWNKGLNTFVDNFMNEGFVAMSRRPCRSGAMPRDAAAGPVLSHVVVYIGDDLILHHLRDRLSSRDLLSATIKRTQCTSCGTGAGYETVILRELGKKFGRVHNSS